MALFVQKFGGSSLADLARIDVLAKRVAQAQKQHQVVVVVSAMAGVTDQLLQQANAFTSKTSLPGVSDENIDFLLASGEQVAASLFALALIRHGCAALALSGAQAGMMTNDCHRKAQIKHVMPSLLQQCIGRGQVPVVCGFQGVSSQGLTTTLNRGGSDLTAVALAAALSADECQIFTDVSGVYTGDPHLVAQAQLLPRITFDQMLLLSRLGAKVLQYESVVYAGRYCVPIRVLSSFDSGPGTLITYEDPMVDKPSVTSVAYAYHYVQLMLRDCASVTNIASEVLADLARHHICADVSDDHVCGAIDLFVRQDQAMLAEQVLRDCQARLAFGFSVQAVSQLSLVGVDMAQDAAIMERLRALLQKLSCIVYGMTTTAIQYTVYMPQDMIDQMVIHVHRSFFSKKMMIST